MQRRTEAVGLAGACAHPGRAQAAASARDVKLDVRLPPGGFDGCAVAYLPWQVRGLLMARRVSVSAALKEEILNAYRPNSFTKIGTNTVEERACGPVHASRK